MERVKVIYGVSRMVIHDAMRTDPKYKISWEEGFAYFDLWAIDAGYKDWTEPINEVGLKRYLNNEKTPQCHRVFAVNKGWAEWYFKSQMEADRRAFLQERQIKSNEKEILDAICKNFPFSRDMVENIYQISKSFDKTIWVLQVAQVHNKTPIEIATIGK